MARDPLVPLTDVQWLLGRAQLSTTQIYLNPMPGDVISGMLAHHRRGEQTGEAQQVAPGTEATGVPDGYRRETLDVLFAGQFPITATVPTATGAAAPAAGVVEVGPDMQELWRSYPPRVCPPRWPSTELSTEAVLARLLTAPFTAGIETNREALQGRRRGLRRLLGWLGEQPGDTWQARWLASGADAMGNAGWWAPVLAWVRPRPAGDGVTVTSNLRVCGQILVCADVIRPSLDWVLMPRAPQNLVALMAQLRDPTGFAELAALCDASAAGLGVIT
jgi:hypothetical protein